MWLPGPGCGKPLLTEGTACGVQESGKLGHCPAMILLYSPKLGPQSRTALPTTWEISSKAEKATPSYKLPPPPFFLTSFKLLRLKLSMLWVNLGLNFPGSGNKKEEKYCLVPALTEKAWSPASWCKALQ